MVLSRPAASLSLKFEFLNARAALKILPLSSRGGAKTPGVGWPKSPVALTAKGSPAPPPRQEGRDDGHTTLRLCRARLWGGSVFVGVLLAEPSMRR
jgi:hypothetical protein